MSYRGAIKGHPLLRVSLSWSLMVVHTNSKRVRDARKLVYDLIISDHPRDCMDSIYAAAFSSAKEYGHEGNLVFGANIAGFLKVADAMMAQGIC